MVSYNVYKATSSGAYVEGVCLASDEKPVVGIANGSILFAVDASNGETTRYMYDKSTMSWVEAECPCSGGGSGGSGGGGSGGGGLEPLIVTFTVPLEGPAVGDKTLGEIFEAASSGRTVIGKLTVLVPAGNGGGEIANVLTLLACSADGGNSYAATFATAEMGGVRLFESHGAASEHPSITMKNEGTNATA